MIVKTDKFIHILVIIVSFGFVGFSFFIYFSDAPRMEDCEVIEEKQYNNDTIESIKRCVDKPAKGFRKLIYPVFFGIFGSLLLTFYMFAIYTESKDKKEIKNE